jgi:hypothetical protein
MASLHPARLLGIDHQLGSLKAGKRASAIALNGGLHLQRIWIQGQVFLYSPSLNVIVAFDLRSQGLYFLFVKNSHVAFMGFIINLSITYIKPPLPRSQISFYFILHH